ncbi:MAG TPA: GyrI-like domain-containing protein [Sediminibacterium sp.]|nr:GyrI-like domain-containing protein [Sediminibacterium sp.]
MYKTNIAKFKLIGLKLNKKTTNEGGQSGIDCGNLWQKFELEKFAELIPNKLSDEIYAVYFNYEGDDTKPFSYFIGCKVEIDTEAPKGLYSLIIPSGNYYHVTAKGKMTGCITDAWKHIWSSGINRTYQYDFEVYDERSKDWNNAEVEIFVSVA